MVRCARAGCTNLPRQQPYPEGRYCRPCYRELTVSRTNLRESDVYLARGRAETGKARSRKQKREKLHNDPGPFLKPRGAKPAPEKPGPALRPLGELPEASPGWWEINDRW